MTCIRMNLSNTRYGTVRSVFVCTGISFNDKSFILVKENTEIIGFWVLYIGSRFSIKENNILIIG